jgi:hypothetical protein
MAHSGTTPLSDRHHHTMDVHAADEDTYEDDYAGDVDHSRWSVCALELTFPAAPHAVSIPGTHGTVMSSPGGYGAVRLHTGADVFVNLDDDGEFTDDILLCRSYADVMDVVVHDIGTGDGVRAAYIVAATTALAIAAFCHLRERSIPTLLCLEDDAHASRIMDSEPGFAGKSVCPIAAIVVGPGVKEHETGATPVRRSYAIGQYWAPEAQADLVARAKRPPHREISTIPLFYVGSGCASGSTTSASIESCGRDCGNTGE